MMDFIVVPLTTGIVCLWLSLQCIANPLFHKKESVRTEKKFKLCNATKW